MEKKSASYKKRQKEMVIRALVDPKFRKMLAQDPEQALGKKQISASMKKEIDLILAMVKGIDAQIGAIADELLCANGGPCGIA